MKDYYGYQMENMGQNDPINNMNMHGSYIHLSNTLEISGTNHVPQVALDIDKKQESL